VPPTDYQLRQNGHLPLVVVTLQTLQGKYNQGLELTTKGDFMQALDVFRGCL
jgi:hypothetical protein